jgi:hypothetical protein
MIEYYKKSIAVVPKMAVILSLREYAFNSLENCSTGIASTGKNIGQKNMVHFFVTRRGTAWR